MSSDNMDTPYPIAFAFHAMAASGNTPGLKAILEQAGLDHAPNIINSRDHRGFTVFHKSMESGNKVLVQMLIELGADINSEITGPDPEGWTPLHLAAFDNHPEIIELLVNRGGQIDHYGNETHPMTPLRVAVTRDHPECVAKLLLLGADPLETNPHGFTLLHEAANIGSCEMTKQLLAAGCSPHAKAGDGSTPAIWALQHGDDDLVSLLKGRMSE